MNGVRLLDLDASEMLDVVHVLYEKDITPSWEREGEIKDAVRTQIYNLMYDRDYQFASSGSNGAANSFGMPHGTDLDSIPELPEIPVESRQTKSYVPPSTDQELANILDPPVN